MRLGIALFVLLLLLCSCVAVLFLVEAPSNASGFSHPTAQDMAVGGDSARHESLLTLGLVFSLLQATFFFGLILLGLRKGGRLVIPTPLLVGFAAYLLTFTALHLSYRSWMNEESTVTFLGFPPPTAWMMFGVWWVPASFILGYVFFFDRWVISDDELESFRKRVGKEGS